MEDDNPYWIYFNFNPFGKMIDDCAVRAIVAATGLDYRIVCKRLGMAYAKGRGLVRQSGVDLNDIKQKFNSYFDIVEDYYENYDFVPDEYKDSKENDELQAFDIANGIDAVSNDTLNDFCNLFAGQGTFLVALAPTKDSKNTLARTNGHIVCAKLGKNARRQGFVDTWDSGDMRVDTYMRVAKTEPKDSPLHWKYDIKKHKFIV